RTIQAGHSLHVSPIPVSRSAVCCSASLGDFFLFDQPQVAAHVESEVAGEKARDSFDVQGTIGKIRAGVRGALHDPDLAWAAIRVVEPPAVVDGGDVIRTAVYEEQGSRLERAQDLFRAAFRKTAAGAQPQHETGQPDERRARDFRRVAPVLNQQSSEIAEWTVEDERLDTRLTRRTQQ